jgi:hypothetical protein
VARILSKLATFSQQLHRQFRFLLLQSCLLLPSLAWLWLANVVVVKTPHNRLIRHKPQ